MEILRKLQADRSMTGRSEQLRPFRRTDLIIIGQYWTLIMEASTNHESRHYDRSNRGLARETSAHQRDNSRLAFAHLMMTRK